ncbi:MAG: hypothetical protein QXU98_13615 [Candidatus Parvarchaeota archaeon]
MTKPIGSFKLSYWTVMMNKRISRKRTLVEHPFETMKILRWKNAIFHE